MLEDKTIDKIKRIKPITFEQIDPSPIGQYRKRAIMKFGEQAVLGHRLVDGKSTNLGLAGLTLVKPGEGSKAVAYCYKEGVPIPYYKPGQN